MKIDLGVNVCVLGPDHLKAHMVVSYKLPGAVYETMLFRRGEPAPYRTWQNDTWEDCITAHAVMWHQASQREQKETKR